MGAGCVCLPGNIRMCGIAGIVDFRGRPIPVASLERLRDALGHRGPDDQRIWRHEAPGFSVGLAHTRLAVLDPTPAGAQPMLDPSGRWVLVYNGELYNAAGLREQLPPPFRTTCDTEVVLKACIACGPAAVERFDAMWALAVVDLTGRTGHLSRDPLGIKPLYYTCRDDRLIFASEMRALETIPDLDLTLDPEGLEWYLNLGFIPHPWTIYRGVYKLPPGHRLLFDAAGPREPERFTHLPPAPDVPPVYEEACGELRRLIEAAVESQRVADVPLGAFLSGGLDSAIVVACLARVGHQPVKTFSIGYPDHPRYDETAYAERVARHLGTEHHTCRLRFADILATVEPMLNHLSEPFADSSLLPAAVVSGHARGQVTVALSGDGGDELFAGYWRYRGHEYIERYRRLPGWLRRGAIEPLLRLAPVARSTPWLDRLRQARKLLRGDRTDFMERHIAWARILDDSPAGQLLVRSSGLSIERMADRYRAAAGAWREGGGVADGLDAVLLADLAIGLPADMLHKVDLASMFHSLEVRVPLLSREVVSFAAGLPIDYRLRGATTKRILRDAFRDLLPEAIIRRGKMGFEVPVGEFLRQELREMYRDVVTPAALADLGLISTVAEDLFTRHSARRQDHTELLWSLLVLCWWRRRRM